MNAKNPCRTKKTNQEVLELLTELLDWAEYMGGWEDPVWEKVKYYRKRLQRSLKGGKPCRT